MFKLLSREKDISIGNWEYSGIRNLKIYLPEEYAGYRSELMERIGIYKGKLGMNGWDIEIVYFGW